MIVRLHILALVYLQNSIGTASSERLIYDLGVLQRMLSYSEDDSTASIDILTGYDHSIFFNVVPI